MNLKTCLLLCCSIIGSSVIDSVATAEEVRILAKNLSAKSDNIAPEYADYDNLTLCVGSGGFMEWTADVDGGTYWVHFYYCSGNRRPCRLSVNGNPQPGDMLADVTGGFMATNLRWQTHGPLEMAKGKSTIRVTADGLMPHLKGLIVSTSQQPPSPETLVDPAEVAARRRRQLNPEGLQAAIEYLGEKYGADYARGGELLGRLDRLDSAKPQAGEEIERLKYEALVEENPLFDFDKLLFVRRYTYQSSHYYTDYIDGCVHFGGNLCVLSLADGKVTELVPQLAGGIFGRFDLSFDGKRVLFDYKAKIGEGFRIWEIGVDGSGLRQITFPPSDEAARITKYKINERYQHHTDDMHPCYLPDGGICFISSRCERGILCDGTDLLTTTTLYRMNAEGSDMQVLSDTPVSEASPSVMNDGRILYTRWEYVDKADVVIKCLWAMRPDGTGSVEVFGNDITFPDTMLHGRAIPGFNNLFVVIGAPHMPLGVGTVIRVDIDRPIRTREPMTYITPHVDVRQEYGYNHGYRQGYIHDRDGKWVHSTAGPLYTDAQPLSDKFFLVSHNPDKSCHDVKAWGLYLLDEFGNHVLIHKDEEMSCWQPIPLRPRKRPPLLPPATEPQKQPGTLVLSDVYEGLQGVPRGTIKYLRVLETVPRPWAARRFWDGDGAYQQHAVVSMNGSLHVKRLHGIVPVEEDGSAHFTVPPDKNLFFQALDEDFMDVQRMRTFINLRPGETRSCVGCHALRQWAPANKSSLALQRSPSPLMPQPGDENALRPIHYTTDVQPILDKHCIECHNPDKPEGELDLTDQLTTLFSRSYENLLSKGLVYVFHENQPKTGEAAPVPPYTMGSHVSRLVELLREGHEDVELSREEFIRLVTWVDANAPYYGSYFGRRNLKYRDHNDFRPLPKLSASK